MWLVPLLKYIKLLKASQKHSVIFDAAQAHDEISILCFLNVAGLIAVWSGSGTLMTITIVPLSKAPELVYCKSLQRKTICEMTTNKERKNLTLPWCTGYRHNHNTLKNTSDYNFIQWLRSNLLKNVRDIFILQAEL